MKYSTSPSSSHTHNKKRTRVNGDSSLLYSALPLRKRPQNRIISHSAIVHIHNLDVPLVSPTTGSPLDSIHLEPDRPYTLGRAARDCDFRFNDRRVSRTHCQVLFDSVDRRVYVVDGTMSLLGGDDVVSEFKKRLVSCDELDSVKPSLNGLFVNGVRVKRGLAKELHAGDEVMLVCGNKGMCGLLIRIGFVIQGLVIKEEVAVGSNEMHFDRPWLVEGSTLVGHSQGSVSGGKRSKRVFAVRASDAVCPCYDFQKNKRRDAVGRANPLLSLCRQILNSDDPISCIRGFNSSNLRLEAKQGCNNKLVQIQGVNRADPPDFSAEGRKEVDNDMVDFRWQTLRCENLHNDQGIVNKKLCCEKQCVLVDGDNLLGKDLRYCTEDDNCTKSKALVLNTLSEKENAPCFDGVLRMKTTENSVPPPGKKFYLNRLQNMDHVTGPFSFHSTISLPELLYPLESILSMFIATFTCDVSWFLSYCKIPHHLPVTIACHNAERCWSSRLDKRASSPRLDFPNLVLVFPQFPEEIAFSKERKRQGVACHHPKLFILERENSIRVIITSANLVANQWNNVTNTVWWQDFPSRTAPDLSSLFVRVSDGETDQHLGSDFSAQLAGFVASLLIDVPSQAYWIMKLAKYNFEEAMGYLVASVPGVYSFRSLNAYECALQTCGVKLLGLVEASVVGLSYLFHSAADTNGAHLKRLAAFIGKSGENANGMLEVLLTRNTNVAADVNAVSVLVPDPDQAYEGDSIQLGFMPRDIAKWVSPLWDSGFFKFSGYIYPKEALAAALGGSNLRVQLILHVSQGPYFSGVTRMMLPEHAIAFCSLVASIRRCVGLWRLQEVLWQYKWPEVEQSDFIYGSSSIGPINAQFLATFAAATGKRSMHFLDSEESDPKWGCWNATEELKNPSIQVLFPTIERVKNASNGVLPSRRILCFSEKTWQRLRTMDILHDAIPHPCDRVGQPMHTKVVRRRFQSKKDASSSGWLYCGSHNFSAAAWGRPISCPTDLKSNLHEKTSFSLGSRLHICNYEIGIVFVFPPAETTGCASKYNSSLDDIVLPFVVPAPKYGPIDRPATAQAMREALTELKEQDQEKLAELASVEETMDEVPEEDEEIGDTINHFMLEKEEEKAYAEELWIQVDSSQSS
ncbi:hypothetical protein K2173_027584 [Erythroxylum novogranatense]|uniref:FHA domain-containing protein n=1 Tax=Erythroxylum novogranatense TaxID=1862640 RepID=A0AAV8TZF5_9ROSI|nr:hypothetical protein K2173_027584 [Erythroxylum novogranatense]